MYTPTLLAFFAPSHWRKNFDRIQTALKGRRGDASSSSLHSLIDEKVVSVAKLYLMKRSCGCFFVFVVFFFF